MKKGAAKTVLLSLMGLALLVAAASRIDPVKQLRRQYNLDPTDPIAESQVASELSLPTPVLAVFRTLAIDYLWIRADNLKQEGQYFDALHLSRLICALQPNIPDVWIFQAWNMAYNISHAMSTPQERWNWVQAGYRLLRDEGIPKNPKTLELYRWLGHIFQHKIGGITDDFHRFYKQKLAFEMMEILGSAQQTNQLFQQLAAAPRSWAAIAEDPNLAPLLNNIIDADPSLTDEKSFSEALLRIDVAPAEYPPKLHQVLADYRSDPALAQLNAFARAATLRREWKLDPQFMLELNRQYGPIDYQQEEETHLSLDWRLPSSHALYWAKRGMLQVEDQDTTAVRNLSRLVYHSLINLYHFGSLKIFTFEMPPDAPQREKGQEILDKTPFTAMRIYNSQDLRMYPIAWQATLDIIDYYEARGEEAPHGMDSAAAYLSWSAISNLYLSDYKKTARRYYRKLKLRFPDNPDYQDPLETFIAKKMAEEFKEITPKAAGAYIDSLLRQSFRLYAYRNDDLATANERRAQQIFQLMGKQTDEESEALRLLGTQDFNRLKTTALENFLDDPSIDFYVKNLLLDRIRLDNPPVFERLMKKLQSKLPPAS